MFFLSNGKLYCCFESIKNDFNWDLIIEIEKKIEM